MIRVNDQESAAVVRHQWGDVQNNRVELNLQLEAPITEAHLWIPGECVRIVARWDPDRITFPPHEGLTKILMSNSVQGSFHIEELTAVEEGWLAVRLRSTGRLQPLNTPR